jgi:hypothetical protein
MRRRRPGGAHHRGNDTETCPRRRAAALAGVAALLAVQACARPLVRVEVPPGSSAVVDELWQPPADLERRDLFHGPGGAARAPENGPYRLIARDTTGFSPGFDVTDGRGTRWNVKIGPEAQSEVVASRVLWAIGYHHTRTPSSARCRSAG